MRMAQNLILLPVLAQILLTLVILALLPRARGASMRERRQRMQDMALAGKTDWNEQAQKTAASFDNQFELPVLFYVVAAFALITRMVDVWCWARVVSCCRASRMPSFTSGPTSSPGGSRPTPSVSPR